jgi:hypothetical protein
VPDAAELVRALSWGGCRPSRGLAASGIDKKDRKDRTTLDRWQRIEPYMLTERDRRYRSAEGLK